jgi:hypothetical protein
MDEIIINELRELQKLNKEFTEEDLKKSNEYENFINIYNNYVATSYNNLQLNIKVLIQLFKKEVKNKIIPYIFTQDDNIDKLFNVTNLTKIIPIVNLNKDILIIPSLINNQITEEIIEYNKILFKILIDYYEIRLNDILGILKNCLIIFNVREYFNVQSVIIGIFKKKNIILSEKFMTNFILFYNIVNIIFNNTNQQIEDNENSKLILLKTYKEYKEFIEEKIITDKFINFEILKNDKNINLINKLIDNIKIKYYNEFIIYDNVNIENKIINKLNQIIYSNKDLHLFPFVSIMQNLLVNKTHEITYYNLLNTCKIPNTYNFNLSNLNDLSYTSLNPMYINTYEILKFKYELLKYYYENQNEQNLINNLKHIYLNYLNKILIEKLIKSNMFYVLYYCDIQYSNYGHEKYKKFYDFIKINANLICQHNIKNNSNICNYINKILNDGTNFNNIELEKILNNKKLENNIKILVDNYINMMIIPFKINNINDINKKDITTLYIVFLNYFKFLTNIIKSLIIIDDENINIKIMKYYYLLNFSLIFLNNHKTFNKLIFNNNNQLDILKEIFPVFSNLFNITNKKNKNILKHIFYFYKLIFLNYSNMLVRYNDDNYLVHYFIFNNYTNIIKYIINTGNNSYIIYKINNYIIEDNYNNFKLMNEKMKIITSDNEDIIKLFKNFKINSLNNVTDEICNNINFQLDNKFQIINRYSYFNIFIYFTELLKNNVNYINMTFGTCEIENPHKIFMCIDIKNSIIYNFDSLGPRQDSYLLFEKYEIDDLRFIILNALKYIHFSNNIKIINLDIIHQYKTSNCTYYAYYFYNYVMSEIHNNKNPQDFINYFNKNRVTGKQLSDFMYNITTPYINMYYSNI